MFSKQKHAFDLASRGFKVFPIRENGKLPIQGTSWFGLVCKDEIEAYARWGEPQFKDANIAIRGEGLLIIDADLYKDGSGEALKALRLPPTFTVKTPRGGYHYYFKTDTPVANSVGKLGAGIDVRGSQGYVVAPGSTIDGRVYEIVDAALVAPAPQHLLDLCQKAQESKQREAADWASPTAASRIEDGRQFLSGARISIEGSGGSNTLYQAATELWDKGIGAQAALELLSEEGGWNERCLPPWTSDELVQHINHAFRYAKNEFGCRAVDKIFGEVFIPTIESEGQIAPNFSDDPVDLWGVFPAPDLPRGVLPSAIEEFALVQGRMMGADPAGLVVAAIVTCAATIDDKFKVQVKRHDKNWLESARIWAALVGSPSTKKTPIITAATAPLCKIDNQMFRDWQNSVNLFEAQPKEERRGHKPPLQKRLRIEDATVEAAQMVLEGSTGGVLMLHDELSGFFGAMEKYSGSKGSSADRAFWLKAFNGGEYALNRIGRGSAILANLSVCLLGGIQPEPIQKVAAASQDDGLLQRLFPIVLKQATIGTDNPAPDVVGKYADIVNSLWSMNKSETNYIYHLDDDAQRIRVELEEKHLQLQSAELVSRKLSSHIGKYDGLFARLCLIWHFIEHAPGRPPVLISGETAKCVATFLHDFLMRHAVAFYGGILGLSDDHERLQSVAGYILTHNKLRMTNRDVQRGDRTMRKLRDVDIRPIFEQLAALGWLERIDGPRAGSQPHWLVNPAVHQKFNERRKQEVKRRADARATIKQMSKSQWD